MLSHRNKAFSISGIFICVLFHSQFVFGYAEYPPARQLICNENGGFWSPSGFDIPNDACKSAYILSGTIPFVQIHQFSALVKDYKNHISVKRKVRNGMICSAGQEDKAGMSLPSSDWQTTLITTDAKGNFNFTWSAPTSYDASFLEFYLTKPEHDFSRPLKWSNLELIDSKQNLFMGSDNKYRVKVNIPSDRSGRAILLTRLQRSHPSGEGFYNCSDIVINQQQNIDPIDKAIAFAIDNKPKLHSLGYLFPTGYPEPKIGNYMSFRGFIDGEEVVEERIKITSDNLANWHSLLAEAVNNTQQGEWQIGHWNKHLHKFRFNNAQLHSNPVWSKNPENTFLLSIIQIQQIDGKEPPSDNKQAEKNTKSIEPWDEITLYREGDKVSYQGSIWQAQWITKGDDPYKSGQWGVWQELQKSVTEEVEDTGIQNNDHDIPVSEFIPAERPILLPSWQKDVVYQKEQQVMYKGRAWTAQWLTKGDEPGTTGKWGAWR